MTPSLPTFFMASAMMLPICLSLLALIVPTWAIMSPLTSLVELLDFFDGHFDGLLDAALEGHRAGAGRDRLHAFAEDGLGQHGGGGGAVAGHVGGLGSDFADHLRAHVLERILQLDFLGDGHAVLGDDRRAELLFDHRVAALGAERDLHGVGQAVDAAQDRLAGILTSHDLLCHISFSSFDFFGDVARLRLPAGAGLPESYFLPPAALAAPPSFARISSSRRIRYSSSSTLMSLPLYLPNRMRSPGFHVERNPFALFVLPAPTAITSPSCGFSLAVSGMMMPPLTDSFSSIRLTSTRSWSGVMLTAIFAIPPMEFGTELLERGGS